MPAPTPTWSWNFPALPAGLKEVRRVARGYARWFTLKGWHPDATDDDQLRVLCCRALHLLHGPATMTGHAAPGDADTVGQFGESLVDANTRAFVASITAALATRIQRPQLVFASGSPIANGSNFIKRRVTGFEGEDSNVPYAIDTAEDDWYTPRAAWWSLRTPLFTSPAARAGWPLARVPQPEHYARLWLTLNRGWDFADEELTLFESYLNAPNAWRNIYPISSPAGPIVSLGHGVDPVPQWGAWSFQLSDTQPEFRSAQLQSLAEVVEPFWQDYTGDYSTGVYGIHNSFPDYASLPALKAQLLHTQLVPRPTIEWEGQTIRAVPDSWHGRRKWVNRTLQPAANWQSTVRRSSKFNALNAL